jgi:hypothetical protein
MPFRASGVMLVPWMVPNGEGSGTPPANGAPFGAVWQAAQSAAAAR